jgi:hypothetical protein
MPPGSMKLGVESESRRGYREEVEGAGENALCGIVCGLVPPRVGSTKNSEGEKASGLLCCDPPSLPAPLAATLGVFFRMGLIQGGRVLDCSWPSGREGSSGICVTFEHVSRGRRGSRQVQGTHNDRILPSDLLISAHTRIVR